MGGAVTVTEQVAVLAPSDVLTVTVALPAALAVTTPVELTVATAVFEEDQDTALLVALAGATVAVSAAVLPTSKDRLVGLTLTPLTGRGLTVTVHWPVGPPYTPVAVMVAVPAVRAVTRPLALTVATDVFEDCHVTSAKVALAGATLAVNVAV